MCLLNLAIRGHSLSIYFVTPYQPDVRIGSTIKDEGFLVPADAPQPILLEFKLKAVHMCDFGGFMRFTESKHVFAIFDSCFAGTIFEARAGAGPVNNVGLGGVQGSDT